MTRSMFTEREDIRMIKWCANEKLSTETNFGLKLWERYVKRYSSQHTPQSLLGRFRRCIVPNLHNYVNYLSTEEIAKSYSHFQDKLEAGSKKYLRQVIRSGELRVPNDFLEQNAKKQRLLDEENVEENVIEENDSFDNFQPIEVQRSENVEKDVVLEETTSNEVPGSSKNGEIQIENCSQSDMDTTLPIPEEGFIEDTTMFSNHPLNEFWNSDMLPYIEFASKDMFRSIIRAQKGENANLENEVIEEGDKELLRKLFEKLFSDKIEPTRKIVIVPLKQESETPKLRVDSFILFENKLKSCDPISCSVHAKNASIIFFMFFEFQLASRILSENESKYREMVEKLLGLSIKICTL